MAQVIANDQSIVVKPWWARVRIIFVGAAIGLLWWILAVILKTYIVEPLACRDLSNAATCMDGYPIAGSIATVLVAVAGTFALVKTLQPRPIIIAVASAALLWTLGQYVSGLAWYEGLLWAIALYAVIYVLFGMIARIVWLPGVFIAAGVTVIAIRLLLIA
jgi:hypothetical protein